MFPSDLLTLENKIIGGLQPISQNVDQTKVGILASNVAYLIRHKLSSQVTANEISVPVIQTKNETWVGITVHQLMKQRVVVVSAKNTNAQDLIAGLCKLATDAVKASMESFSLHEEVVGRMMAEVDAGKAGKKSS